MKYVVKPLLTVACVLFVCFCLGGCVSVELNRSYYSFDQKYYTPEQVSQMVYDHVGVNFVHTGLDTDFYTPVPYGEMDKVSRIWKELILPFLPEYKINVFDCSQFTETFAYHMQTKYGEDVAVFGLAVKVKETSRYGHVLNIIITDAGPVWLEPQTGEWGKLKTLDVFKYHAVFNDPSFYQ